MGGDDNSQVVVWEVATGKTAEGGVNNPSQYLKGGRFAGSPDGTSVAHASGSTVYVSRTQ